MKFCIEYNATLDCEGHNFSVIKYKYKYFCIEFILIVGIQCSQNGNDGCLIKHIKLKRIEIENRSFQIV